MFTPKPLRCTDAHGLSKWVDKKTMLQFARNVTVIAFPMG